MKRKSTNTKKTKGIYSLLSILNDNKFFAGVIMLIMNIGSKYVSIELSKTQENYIKYSLGRQILVFAILWVGTRDIFTSLVLTAVFILLADYLFNENSKFCLIPEKYKELDTKIITGKDINDAINTLKIAQKNKNKEGDVQINRSLYKENFI
jgi:hypothetical protein